MKRFSDGCGKTSSRNEEWSDSRKNQFVTALPDLMTTSARMTSFTIGIDSFQDTLK
jgi:hypothetical protein